METEKMIQLVALVAALLQMLKAIPLVDKFKPWLPVASVAIGIMLSFLVSLPEPIVAGVMIGLSASGGYSSMKSKRNGEVVGNTTPLPNVGLTSNP